MTRRTPPPVTPGARYVYTRGDASWCVVTVTRVLAGGVRVRFPSGLELELTPRADGRWRLRNDREGSLLVDPPSLPAPRRPLSARLLRAPDDKKDETA